MYLTASTMIGVICSDHCEDPDSDFLSPSEFYESLATLGTDEIICAYFGPDDFEIYVRIRDEYGFTEY